MNDEFLDYAPLPVFLPIKFLRTFFWIHIKKYFQTYHCRKFLVWICWNSRWLHEKAWKKLSLNFLTTSTRNHLSTDSKPWHKKCNSSWYTIPLRGSDWMLTGGSTFKLFCPYSTLIVFVFPFLYKKIVKILAFPLLLLYSKNSSTL